MFSAQPLAPVGCTPVHLCNMLSAGERSPVPSNQGFGTDVPPSGWTFYYFEAQIKQAADRSSLLQIWEQVKLSKPAVCLIHKQSCPAHSPSCPDSFWVSATHAYQELPIVPHQTRFCFFLCGLPQLPSQYRTAALTLQPPEHQQPPPCRSSHETPYTTHPPTFPPAP